MLKKIKQAWNDVKAWFNYAWSIFIARMEVLFGILVAAIGSVDFSLVFTQLENGLKWTTATTIGAILIVKGIISEIGRRQNTVTLSNGQLFPAQVSEKVEARKVLAQGPQAVENK